MSGHPTWYQPPPQDSTDFWGVLYHVSTMAIFGMMVAGAFMYPASDPERSQSRPAFLPYLPLAYIAIGVGWTLLAPSNRRLRWILLAVFVASPVVYVLMGPWWGLGASVGGSYLVQGLRFATYPPSPNVRP